jgi:2-dehydro-3-deoxyphosphogluconate aldolase/(4S)-4-hydroxy-2-oxoglutarate aldolase
MSEDTLERLRALRVVAVLRGESAQAAVEVADALVEGGVRGLEVTFTTPDAGDALRELRARHGDDALVGAGTVTAPEHVDEAAEAGAAFLVSPGLDPELVGRMRATGLLCLPGVLTPSEVLGAVRLGLRALKLFPGSLGGPAHLKALRAPFPEVEFVPTGGVSAENAADWLAAGALAVGAGGSLAPASLAGRERADVVAGARALVAAAEGAA